jgi:hypothetical protein
VLTNLDRKRTVKRDCTVSSLRQEEIGGLIMNVTNRISTDSVRVWARRVLGLGFLIFVGAASSLHSSELLPSGSGEQFLAAEAGGWRLAVSRPVAGSTSAPQAVICYEVIGTTREPVVALEITPMWPGAGPAADSVRVPATVGRSSVVADLSAVGERTIDLRVQLLVDGSAAGRPALLIPGVTLLASAPPGTCSWTTATTDKT